MFDEMLAVRRISGVIALRLSLELMFVTIFKNTNAQNLSIWQTLRYFFVSWQHIN